MPQPTPDQPPDWGTLGIWAGVVVTVLLACGSAVRVFFGLVSRRELHDQLKEERAEWAAQLAEQREEFARQLEAQRAAFMAQHERQDRETYRMHEENRDTAKQIFERVSDVEQAVARIEGSLSGRYPGIPR